MHNDWYKYLDVEVLYMQRIGLPQGVTVSLDLNDVSQQDVAAKPLASQSVRTNGNVPIHFQLRYDPRVVDADLSYSLTARIELDGLLLFTNTNSYLVTLNGSQAKIMMVLQGSPLGFAAQL
ncbi:YbaY family lipoprotein [Pseudomonas sp. P66]|jgi:putative lipoprotein|uniref:YbaY family lipoprotein n=1 Tax=Pseudomonas arcuscaelestis TaxID=2710591 RepID=A0ABS2BXJ1_9PSED|nr:YbaY family lipoprotein [Pseudomonas arcuscaelestis]MBM3109380.1 YbaY family lipoprotein [Pseudomonas arcuscaelestis]MBM5458327.1 YbaY family lipoprotein [Pseudomonas arcuscaelestis]